MAEARLGTPAAVSPAGSVLLLSLLHPARLPRRQAGLRVSRPAGVLVPAVGGHPPGRPQAAGAEGPGSRRLQHEGQVIVLGVNAYHGDVSAALLRDGHLVAAVEEERFTRVKHAAGFPRHAIAACLTMAGVTAAEIDHVAISRDPRANLLRKVWFALRN